MKKRSLKIIALTMSLCMSATLGGCAANISAEQQPTEQAYDSGNTSSVNSLSMAEAYENDEAISTEEQVKVEETRRDEIAEQYSIYEPYGMTYDKEKDRFFITVRLYATSKMKSAQRIQTRSFLRTVL